MPIIRVNVHVQLTIDSTLKRGTHKFIRFDKRQTWVLRLRASKYTLKTTPTRLARTRVPSKHEHTHVQLHAQINNLSLENCANAARTSRFLWSSGKIEEKGNTHNHNYGHFSTLFTFVTQIIHKNKLATLGMYTAHMWIIEASNTTGLQGVTSVALSIIPVAYVPLTCSDYSATSTGGPPIQKRLYVDGTTTNTAK